MILKRTFICGTIVTAVTSLLACTGNTKQHQASVDDAIKSAGLFTPSQWATSVDPAELDQAKKIDWLDVFNDDQLKTLVNEALANNYDLAAAAANVDRANALAIQAGTQVKPQVNLSFAGSRAGTADTSRNNTSSQNLSAQVSWEADIWGRVAAGKRAASASAEAARADYTFARHSMAASTSKAYFIAIEAGRQALILSEILSALEKTLSIVTVQYENGLASAQDLALTKSDIAGTREQLVAIEASKREALRALEVLTGKYPSAELIVSTALPELPKMPPLGLPSDILERRPDIIASERRVAAAFDSVKQAKAAKLPSFGLTSSAGGPSRSLSDILKPSNIAWQLAGNLLMPVFDGGARDAQVDIANAEQEQALAAYAQNTLNAFTEVENNLDLATSLVQRREQLSIALNEANKAYELTQLQYKEGEIALVDLLTIQQRVLSASSSLTSVKREALEQRINLYLALGGNW